MKFVKFHGFGNDYIVFEAEQVASVTDICDFGRRVCDRHYGAGADGITVVKRSETPDADWSLVIVNPDGSIADLSGNGTRCTVAYLYYKKLWAQPELRLATKSGVKLYKLRAEESPGHYWFESELGRPGLSSAETPMLTATPLNRVIDYPLRVAGHDARVTALAMGNPNCSIFVEDFDSLDWRLIGKHLEVHPAFPARVNVTFVRVVDRDNIEIRIWERGAGETFSSGTCSSAAAVASIIRGHCNRQVKVHTEGGALDVKWRETDDVVVLNGRADIVYAGEWLTG
jgi:diaminopimelate epimerase